jgi:hypothetical protein
MGTKPTLDECLEVVGPESSRKLAVTVLHSEAVRLCGNELSWMNASMVPLKRSRPRRSATQYLSFPLRNKGKDAILPMKSKGE